MPASHGKAGQGSGAGCERRQCVVSSGAKDVHRGDRTQDMRSSTVLSVFHQHFARLRMHDASIH